VLTFDFPFAPGLSDDDDDDEVVDLSGLLEDDDVSEGVTSGADSTNWKPIEVNSNAPPEPPGNPH